VKDNALVTDTHPLLHFALGNDKRLSRKARKAFQQFEQGALTLYIPAPVVFESWLLWLGGKIEVPTTLNAWWKSLDGPGLVHVELNHDDVLAASELDWDHRDVFDRLIVVMAQRIGVPLLSADEKIREFADVETVW
jgi:PIN domain nuclease of toxin-antitoxin system